MSRTTYFLVSSILQNSNNSKQKIGARVAYFLGLTPRPRGADDGIDGFFESEEGLKIHFQSKLRGSKLDISDAREYFSDIAYHRADVSIMLSGKGFKDTFKTRLFGHPGIEDVEIHLLELADLFDDTAAFETACSSVPGLRSLQKEIIDDIE